MKAILTLAILALTSFALHAQRKFDVYQKNTMDGTKLGVTDKFTGDTVLHPLYDKINSYSDDGYFLVTVDGKMGVVDTNEKTIIPIKYAACSNIYDGRAFVSLGDKYALADNTGKLLSGYIYEDACDFQEGFACVQMAGKTGFIDKTGKVIIPCKYIDVKPFYQGVAIVHINKWEDIATANVKYWNGTSEKINVGATGKFPIVYNTKGQALYRGESYEEIEITTLGYLVTTKSSPSYGQVGQIIDPTGKFIISYSQPHTFYTKDYGIIVKDWSTGKYGVVNYKGEVVIKPNFRYVEQEIVDDGTYYKVIFENGDFFYTDVTGKCTELKGKPCPE